MGGLRLREAAVGLLLGRVDQVGELHRVLDEEHRDVVADDVPVALARVELDREAADVAGEVGGALVAGDGREADEGLDLLAVALEDVGAGDVGEALEGLEAAVGAEAAGVDDALGDALVVEVEDLLAEGEVLEQAGAAGADLQGVLVVGDRDALLGGHHRMVATRDLMGLAGGAGDGLRQRVVELAGHGGPPLGSWLTPNQRRVAETVPYSAGRRWPETAEPASAGRAAKTRVESAETPETTRKAMWKSRSSSPAAVQRPARSSTPPASATPVASEICCATELIAVAWLRCRRRRCRRRPSR